MTTRNASAADPRQFSDAAIAAAAAHALEMDRAIPGGKSGVHVAVAGGNATISGTVHFAYQKDEAEDVVRHVNGVRQVINQIVIQGGVEPVDDCC